MEESDTQRSTAASEVVATAARLSGQRGRVVLHSGNSHDETDRWSFVSCAPYQTIEAWGSKVTIRDRTGTIVSSVDTDPIQLLDTMLTACQSPPFQGPNPVAIGYLGYELAQHIKPLSLGPIPASDTPDMWFGFYRAVWRYDHQRQQSAIIGSHKTDCDDLRAALARDRKASQAPVFGPLHPPEDQIYRAGVHQILRYIRAGDVYQVNLARRLIAPVLTRGDALAVYSALHTAAPASFGALLETDHATLISGSPECFLYRDSLHSRLITRPIKGTRGRTKGNDTHLKTDLAADPKEQAEHLMIVDLERNDLGRIAKTGSVHVDKLGYVITLPTLYHMVSQISCDVRDDIGPGEILRATFPGGSITGAPKIRAMEIINELEQVPRGPYTGAIGYFGQNGAMNLSIAIRTAVLTNNQIRLHVGGGIVADSTASRELQETEEKASGWRMTLDQFTDRSKVH